MAKARLLVGKHYGELGRSLSTPVYSKLHCGYAMTLKQIKPGAKFQYGATKEISALTEAIRIYKVADLFLNRIKKEQLDLYSKLFWRGDSRRLYENAMNACYMSTNSKDAFYFFEKSRAVLLNDQLNEQRWVEEKDILKQTQLKKEYCCLKENLKA